MSEATPAPKKKSKLVLIAGIVLLVGMPAGGGAFWWARMRRQATPTSEPAHEVVKVERGLVSFDPFVVNLADGRSRFLRVTIQAVVESPELAEKIQKTPFELMRARSAMLELLTVQNADTLVKPEGKTALKKDLADRLVAALDGAKVLDVLFADFVIQF